MPAMAYLSGGAACLPHFFGQSTQQLHKPGLLLKLSPQSSPTQTQQRAEDAVITLTKRWVLQGIPQQPTFKPSRLYLNLKFTYEFYHILKQVNK